MGTGCSYTYTYNGYGQRVARNYTFREGASGNTPVQIGQITSSSKTYVYDHAGRLIAENASKTLYGENTVSEDIVFLYDESSIIGMVHTVGGTASTYYFQRNLQGDVVAIYDARGFLKAKYLYDAWGNCTISSETTDYTVANANPIRYRGYYYDDDTGLYYCNARYYSPKWRRFISPDDTAYLDPETPNGLNLYSYCLNNPVMYVDPTGHFAISSILIGLAIGSLVSWGLSEILGAQIAGGIGSVAGGGAAIYTGIGLLSFGPVGWIAGGAMILVGAGTIAFGANEIVAGASGINYIQQWTGMSDGLYNGLYVGLNIASSVGSIAGNIGMQFASTAKLNAVMKNPELIRNYSKFQFKTYARYSNQWSLLPSRNGKGMRALSLINNGNSIRYGYGINNPEHYFGAYYWIVTNDVGKYRFPFA